MNVVEALRDKAVDWHLLETRNIPEVVFQGYRAGSENPRSGAQLHYPGGQLTVYKLTGRAKFGLALLLSLPLVAVMIRYRHQIQERISQVGKYTNGGRV